ncbi:MAG: U32 family peptidase [Clostridia bacterium]|nr:U32 family peptidase [Clostridia bacterium]
MSLIKSKPELLSPAGNWEAMVAAVQNGADAVYLGGKALNARRGAGNFDSEELIKAGEYLHERARKLYVTVNTMVKQSELALLEDIAAQLYACKADAAIVQDAGVCEELRRMLPGFRLHASTQMAICNMQGAEYLKNRGFERVVLAREMSLDEIKACVNTGIETEVFCHGALCVACSGQCLFSSMVGGRSGNRGACAQPCRLKYTLNGAANASGYLLSPKDLNTAPILDKLVNAGVTSLKIEGRLKRPEYVATVTRIYRRLLDGEDYTRKDDEELKQIFNRGGFTLGYIDGIRDGEFLSVKRPSHWGVEVAKAENSFVRLEKDIRPDDALVLRNDDSDETPVKLSGAAGEKLKNTLKQSGLVYRMVSESQMEKARESYKGETKPLELTAYVRIKRSEPLKLTLSDGSISVSCESTCVEEANSLFTQTERLAQQIKKTGGTAYTVNQVMFDADDGLYVSVSAVNAIRREAVEKMRLARIKANEPHFGFQKPGGFEHFEAAKNAKLRIVVQSGDKNMLRRLLDEGADEAVYEPDDIRKTKLESLDLSGMYLCLPPVLPQNTLRLLNDFALEAAGIRGVYVSNAAHLDMKWPGEIRYDFPLNIANTPAMSYIGVRDKVFTPSVELTTREINDLGGNRELIVYGRIPLMRLRHCPLNAARHGDRHVMCRACDSASEGKRLGNCSFTDRMKASFPLRRLASDDGCIITLLNSVPLNLSGHMSDLPKCDGWRLIFTDESPDKQLEILRSFIKIRESGTDIEPASAFTTGHYFRKTE